MIGGVIGAGAVIALIAVIYGTDRVMERHRNRGLDPLALLMRHPAFTLFGKGQPMPGREEVQLTPYEDADWKVIRARLEREGQPK